VFQQRTWVAFSKPVTPAISGLTNGTGIKEVASLTISRAGMTTPTVVYKRLEKFCEFRSLGSPAINGCNDWRDVRSDMLGYALGITLISSIERLTRSLVVATYSISPILTSCKGSISFTALYELFSLLS